MKLNTKLHRILAVLFAIWLIAICEKKHELSMTMAHRGRIGVIISKSLISKNAVVFIDSLDM